MLIVAISFTKQRKFYIEMPVMPDQYRPARGGLAVCECKSSVSDLMTGVCVCDVMSSASELTADISVCVRLC